MYLTEYFYRVKIIEPILPVLSKTFLTPNMITIFNCFFSLLIYYLAYQEQFLIAAIGIQIFVILDTLDGSLARYKDMQSKFGAKLDDINDRVFYTLIFIFIGIKSIPLYLIVLVILLVNLYAIIAAYYITPRLSRLKTIERRGLKKYFMDRGFILGMDLGNIDLLISLFLILNEIYYLYIVLAAGLILDLTVRLLELKRNEKLQANVIS